MKTTMLVPCLAATLACATAQLPQGASAPDPADRSRVVDPGKVVLRWVPVPDAVAHRIFFGESEPPLFREEMSRLRYEPGPLSPGTTYYWRVDELTRSGIIVGRVWNFTTAESPSSAAVGTAALPWSRCLSQPAKWYGTAEALRVAENVLLYQRKTGGWPKNIDMAIPLSDSGRARVGGDKGLNDSTIDNDSTTTQIRFSLESTSRQGGNPWRRGYQPAFASSWLRNIPTAAGLSITLRAATTHGRSPITTTRWFMSWSYCVKSQRQRRRLRLWMQKHGKRRRRQWILASRSPWQRKSK